MTVSIRLLGVVRFAPELIFADGGLSMLDLSLSGITGTSPQFGSGRVPIPLSGRVPKPWSFPLRLFGKDAERQFVHLGQGDPVLCECRFSPYRDLAGQPALGLKVLQFRALEESQLEQKGELKRIPHAEGGFTLEGGENQVRVLGRLGNAFVIRGEGHKRFGMAGFALLDSEGLPLTPSADRAVKTIPEGLPEATKPRRPIWIDLTAWGDAIDCVSGLVKGQLLEVVGALKLRYRPELADAEASFQMQVAVESVLSLRSGPHSSAAFARSSVGVSDA